MSYRVIAVGGRVESEWDSPYDALAHLMFDLDLDHLQVGDGNRAYVWRDLRISDKAECDCLFAIVDTEGEGGLDDLPPGTAGERNRDRR